VAEKSWDQKVAEALDAIDALYDDSKATDQAKAKVLEDLQGKCDDLLDVLVGDDDDDFDEDDDWLYDEEDDTELDPED
jgi:hypothetical protein